MEIGCLYDKPSGNDRGARNKEKAKSLLEVTVRHLRPRNLDMRIRLETVQLLTNTCSFDRVLDNGIGCNLISQPRLPRCGNGTLLDLFRRIPDLDVSGYRQTAGVT